MVKLEMAIQQIRRRENNIKIDRNKLGFEDVSRFELALLLFQFLLLCWTFEYITRDVGFEVLTALTMKSSVFWDITLTSPVKVNRRFRGTYRLSLRDRRVSQQRNHYEVGSKQSRHHAGFLLALIFKPEVGRHMFL
jgi:hypothetical protein